MRENHNQGRTEKTAIEARAGATGHNVRFVLAVSLISAIVVFAGLLYFRSF